MMPPIQGMRYQALGSDSSVRRTTPLVSGILYLFMLVTGGLNDPRVSHWEPAKWVAKLRALKTDNNVLLLKTNMGSGHFGPSGRYEGIKEAAVDYAFLLWATPHAGILSST
jgi:protease II